MTVPKFDFDDAGSGAPDVAGTPEGDGDFETDNLPDTGETTAGGQVLSKKNDEGVVDPDAHAHPTGLLEKVIDAISHRTLLP